MIDHDALALAAQALQPLSQTAVRLSQLFANEEWDVDDVIEAVSFDAPLTGRILRAANSAKLGGASRVGTIEQAIVRMGSGVVVRLAVGVSVRGAMMAEIPQLGAREGELWRHDVATAVATEVIPLVSKRRVPPEAFTTSLLHDVGRIIMYQQVEEGLMRQIEAARAAGETAVAAERAILGADHGEIGALVAQAWNLPEPLVQAIRLHEEPAEAADHKAREICDIVKVSDAVARKIGFQCGEKLEDVIDLPGSLARLGLDRSKLDELGELALERFEEVLAQFE
ncbi:MAG: HDOD domain-containing protein [Myxococcota bacterium]